MASSFVAQRILLATLVMVSAGCGGAPRSVVLHYAARDATGWTERDAGCLVTTACGAEIAAVLGSGEPTLELAIANPGAAVLEVRVGPEATRSTREPIGEVQHRRLDGRSGEGNSDYLPYLSQQPLQVQPATRTVFFLDRALGRAPALGQYFVLVVELQAASGARQRRLLPLQVVADPVPAAAR